MNWQKQNTILTGMFGKGDQMSCWNKASNVLDLYVSPVVREGPVACVIKLPAVC